MKPKRHEEPENHERWLISYADFITLLFAFFVVMYATSTNNVEKQKSFEDSVRATLNLGSSLGSNVGTNSAAGKGKSEIPQDEDLDEYVERELEKRFPKAAKDQSIAGVRHDLMGLKITLAASAFFPVGSAKIKKEALPALDRVGEILKRSERKIIVEGHTDDQTYVGPSGETNWELASNRATSVVRYLIKIHRLDPHRMAAISYADQKPLAANDTEENRAKNRRIEILLVADGKN